MKLSKLIDKCFEDRNEHKDALQEIQSTLNTLSALYLKYGNMEIDSDLVLIDPLWKEKVQAINLEILDLENPDVFEELEGEQFAPFVDIPESDGPIGLLPFRGNVHLPVPVVSVKDEGFQDPKEDEIILDDYLETKGIRLKLRDLENDVKSTENGEKPTGSKELKSRDWKLWD